jgi:hypothetical protein
VEGVKPALSWKRGVDLRDERGIYRYGGRAYPSVTTVLEPHDDFLWVHLAAIRKEVEHLKAHVETGETVEVWTEHEGAWLREEKSPLELLQDGGYIANAGLRFLKQRADRGSVIHDILEDLACRAVPDESDLQGRLEEHVYGKGRSCTVEECLPFARSLLRWWAEFQPEIVLSEGAVFNDTHEYAGRLDCILYMQGQLWNVDLKTSSSFRRSWMAQVVAYSKAEFSLVCEPGSDIQIEWPMMEGLPCAILQVKEDRAVWRPVNRIEERFNEFFLPALQAYKANRAGTGQKLPPRGQTLKVMEDGDEEEAA